MALVVKNLSANAGDLRDIGSIPGWERFPGGEHGNSLLHSCLENPMNRGAWWATVHKSWTRLKRLSTLSTCCAKLPQSCLTLCDCVGFSRQECRSGLPCSPPGDLPHPGIKPVSLMYSSLADGFFTTSATREALVIYYMLPLIM